MKRRTLLPLTGLILALFLAGCDSTPDRLGYYDACINRDGTGSYSFTVVGTSSAAANSNENTNTNTNVNSDKARPVITDQCYPVFKTEIRVYVVERWCGGTLDKKCRDRIAFIFADK